MQLQTNSHAQGTLFALLGAIETSVSGHHDASLDPTSFANSNHWQSAKAIGGTQMTPLAQSFQTLYNTLEQLSYSFDDTAAPEESLSLATTDTPVQKAGHGLVSTDTHLLSEVNSNPLEPLPPMDDSLANDSALPSRGKVAEDVAVALERAILNSANLADAVSFEGDDEAAMLTQGRSRLQTPQANTSKPHISEILHRLQVDSFLGHSSDSLPEGMSVLSQYASSMQSQTPNSLKVNEASWRAVVSQWQPANGQLANHQIGNSLSAPTSTESLITTLEHQVTRGASLNILVEKSLPIAAQKQLYQVVKDKVQLQVDMNNQVARIRFDPPELGRMEMVLRIEGDKLTVQMTATAATTREVLMATSERLRHELVAQNSALSEVEVAFSQQHHSASPEQHLPSFVDQEHEGSSGEESPNVPEYTAYIARV